jgi:hypothetical protein
MKKILLIALLIILMLSFVGCGSINGTYKSVHEEAMYANYVIIIEDDVVTYVGNHAVFYDWEQEGDCIYLTYKDDSDMFYDHNNTLIEYTIKIVDGGILFCQKNIETGNEDQTFCKKLG